MSYFSIIIPVYNRTEQMGESIDSIRCQTFRDFEVILVDDGSNEASRRQLQEFCTNDSRFRLISHDVNRSVIAARYTGMKQVQSPYTLFVDSDDILSDNALSLLYERLQKHPVDLLRFGHEEVYRNTLDTRKTIDEKNRYITPLQTSDSLAAMLRDEMAPNVWKNCYSKPLIDRALARAEVFYCNMCEDTYWSTAFLSCAETEDVLDACLYHYIIGGGMSTVRNKHTKEQLIHYVKDIEICTTHIQNYLTEYAPKYLNLVEGKYLRMNCFLLLVFLIDEPDLKIAADYLNVFDTERLQSVYAHGRDFVIPFKLQTANNAPGSSIFYKNRKINYLEDLMP